MRVSLSSIGLRTKAQLKLCRIVEYATRDQAQTAVNTLSNQNLMGRLVYVREVSRPWPSFNSSNAGVSDHKRCGRIAKLNLDLLDRQRPAEVMKAVQAAEAMEGVVTELLLSQAAGAKSSSTTFVTLHPSVLHSESLFDTLS